MGAQGNISLMLTDSQGSIFHGDGLAGCFIHGDSGHVSGEIAILVGNGHGDVIGQVKTGYSKVCGHAIASISFHQEILGAHNHAGRNSTLGRLHTDKHQLEVLID